MTTKFIFGHLSNSSVSEVEDDNKGKLKYSVLTIEDAVKLNIQEADRLAFNLELETLNAIDDDTSIERVSESAQKVAMLIRANVLKQMHK